MAWKKKEKRIVSKTAEVVPTVETKSLIPSLKTALVPKQPKEIAERENVFHPGKKEENEEIHRAEVRHRVGLNYELLCERVRDGLNAEMAILDSEGKIVNKVPANSERAKFIQAAIDILGAKKADVGAQKIPSIIIVLPNGERLK